MSVAVAEEARLDATFAALANPTRRAILRHLSSGDATVNELAEPIALSLPAISRHLRVLEDAGLIQRQRRAQFRPCVLDPAALESVMSWAAECQQTWRDRFDRLDQQLSQARPTTKNGAQS